jgi:hypothetical protein
MFREFAGSHPGIDQGFFFVVQPQTGAIWSFQDELVIAGFFGFNASAPLDGECVRSGGLSVRLVLTEVEGDFMITPLE